MAPTGVRWPIAWRLVAVCAAGVCVEAGCLWIWAQSPQLTAHYSPDFTRAFFARLPWLQVVADQPDLDRYAKVLQLFVGFAPMCVGYLLALWALAGSTHAPAPIVVGFSALFRLTLGLLPGLFSTDVFSYVMYGRIPAVHGANPYVLPPSAFGDDPFLGWVFEFWRDQPTVYGALWTDLSWLLSWLTASTGSFEQVMTYRVCLIALEAVTLAVLWRLLNGRLQAWALFAWNPLVLFDLVGSTHNDVAMLALLVLGMTFAVGGGWLIGLVSVTLGALVKYATAVVVPVMVVAWSAQATLHRERVLRLFGGLGVPFALAVLLWWPWLTTPSAMNVLADAAGGRLVLNSAPDVLALTIADRVLVPSGVAADEARAATRFWTRLVARAIFGVYFVLELAWVWRLARRGQALMAVPRASTRLLLVVPLLVFTWVWSWYFTWSLALATVLGCGSRLTRLVVAYTLVALPVVYAHQYLTDDLSGGFVVLMAVVPLLVLVVGWRPAAARKLGA